MVALQTETRGTPRTLKGRVFLLKTATWTKVVSAPTEEPHGIIMENGKLWIFYV